MFFFETLQTNLNFYLYSIEELFLVFFLFSIVKLVILCIIIELIWPTHFFNKRHNINFYSIKLRDFQSTLLKLRPKSNVYTWLKIVWKYYYCKC